MTNEQKQQVKNALVRFAISFPTQAEAASHLSGVSPTTLSLVKNNNWASISDHVWYNIARQVGYYTPAWKPADTSAYLLLRILFGDARNYAMTYGIAIAKGLGKTYTANRYKQEYDNVCYLACSDTFTGRAFITALLHQEGLEAKGSVPEMVEQFTNHISDKDAPLLILDDADQLKDRAIHILLLIANKLAGNAGIIIMGSPKIRARILDGVRLKKQGFEELYKTIGKRFVTLNEAGTKDVELLCNANGVHDADLVEYIVATSQGNLHQAARLIQQTYQQNKAA